MIAKIASNQVHYYKDKGNDIVQLDINFSGPCTSSHTYGLSVYVTGLSDKDMIAKIKQEIKALAEQVKAQKIADDNIKLKIAPIMNYDVDAIEKGGL